MTASKTDSNKVLILLLWSSLRICKWISKGYEVRSVNPCTDTFRQSTVQPSLTDSPIPKCSSMRPTLSTSTRTVCFYTSLRCCFWCHQSHTMVASSQRKGSCLQILDQRCFDCCFGQAPHSTLSWAAFTMINGISQSRKKSGWRTNIGHGSSNSSWIEPLTVLNDVWTIVGIPIHDIIMCWQRLQICQSTAMQQQPNYNELEYQAAVGRAEGGAHRFCSWPACEESNSQQRCGVCW